MQNFNDANEIKRLTMERAVTEADHGSFVSEEAMTKWFVSIGTERELPEPNEDNVALRT